VLCASEICQRIQNHVHCLRETLRQYLGYPMRNRLLYQVKTCGLGVHQTARLLWAWGHFQSSRQGLVMVPSCEKVKGISSKVERRGWASTAGPRLGLTHS